MKSFLSRLSGNSFILPALVVLIGSWRIFLPNLSANGGLGWDGWKYYDLTVNAFDSQVLDSYLILRILPSYLIHIAFKLLGIPFEVASVILAFKIMNTVLLGISGWMVKKIFEKYQLNSVSQVVGFALVFLNYGVLHFTYYYPVMTDTPALFLAVALFYFFVRGELLNVLLVGLLGAFTWPLLLPMSFALSFFSNSNVPFLTLPKVIKYLAGVLCVIYALGVSWYFIIHKGERASDMYTLPISEKMLPAGFLFIALLYFFFSYTLINKEFLKWSYYRSQISANKIFAITGFALIFYLVRSSLQVNASSEFLSPFTQVAITMVYAFQRPMISLVSHFNYFGVAVILYILFWKELSAFISQFGLGVSGIIFFSLFLFFAQAESRRLVYFFPWMMIIMALFLGKYRFTNIFYIILILLNFVTAKLWIIPGIPAEARLLEDGTINFPEQWFFMHLGRWMTEEVWLCLCGVVIISLLVLVLSLYKIKFGTSSVLFYKKFETVNYG